MLWLIFCRHGVIHTQSLQKLLLEDDVAKPEGMVVTIRNRDTKRSLDAFCVQPLRVDTVNAPFPVKLVHALQRLNELQDLIPLAIKHKLPETKEIMVKTQETHRTMS